MPPKGAASTWEASGLYGIEKRHISANLDGKEVIKLVSIRNPYTAVIGVAGAHEAQNRTFDIKFKLTSR